jgi:DNA-binding IclR family transcriptional regulator
MNIVVTRANQIRARAMAEIVEAGALTVSVPVTDTKGRRVLAEPVSYPNPAFQALVQGGNVPAERLANVRAFLDALDADETLRSLAVAQGLDPGEWEEMLREAVSNPPEAPEVEHGQDCPE